MSAGELIGRCFHARTVAHILHLKTRSYASHKALNEFYDEIVPLADSFAEVYQGEYGLITSYPSKFSMSDEPIPMLEELADWVQKHRHSICDEADTHLQNIIDEIVALIRSSLYKLRFLR